MSLTLAVAAAAEQAASSQDAVHESFQVLFEGTLSQHTRLPLVDEVFKAFIDTNVNQGRHYTFSDLLNITRKKYFRFEHFSIPYLATILPFDGPDRDWVSIKLCNDGFEYIAKEGRLISRHKSDSWIALAPGDALRQFPSLVSATVAKYDNARVYYNYPHKRLDIKLYPRDAGTPGLLVTYEPGYPYMDDDAPLGRLP